MQGTNALKNPNTGEFTTPPHFIFSLLNGKFIQSLPDAVKNRLPFDAIEVDENHAAARTLVDRDLILHIQRIGQPNGPSAAALANEIEEAHRYEHVRVRTLYYEHCSYYTHHTFTSMDRTLTNPIPQFPQFEVFAPQMLDPRTLRRLYLQDFCSREFFQNRLMACIFGEILAMDVTHLKAVFNGVGVSKHLTVMNENNMILLHTLNRASKKTF